MSKVYIKDMKMPKSCFGCQFCDEDENNNSICSITRIIFEENYDYKRRYKDCPLREVEVK